MIEVSPRHKPDRDVLWVEEEKEAFSIPPLTTLSTTRVIHQSSCAEGGPPRTNGIARWLVGCRVLLGGAHRVSLASVSKTGTKLLKNAQVTIENDEQTYVHSGVLLRPGR